MCVCVCAICTTCSHLNISFSVYQVYNTGSKRKKIEYVRLNGSGKKRRARAIAMALLSKYTEIQVNTMNDDGIKVSKTNEKPTFFSFPNDKINEAKSLKLDILKLIAIFFLQKRNKSRNSRSGRPVCR